MRRSQKSEAEGPRFTNASLEKRKLPLLRKSCEITSLLEEDLEATEWVSTFEDFSW